MWKLRHYWPLNTNTTLTVIATAMAMALASEHTNNIFRFLISFTYQLNENRLEYPPEEDEFFVLYNFTKHICVNSFCVHSLNYLVYMRASNDVIVFIFCFPLVSHIIPPVEPLFCAFVHYCTSEQLLEYIVRVLVEKLADINSHSVRHLLATGEMWTFVNCRYHRCRLHNCCRCCVRTMNDAFCMAFST